MPYDWVDVDIYAGAARTPESNAITAADIALIAYTRVAHKAGFDMAPYASVDAWINRCEATLDLSDEHPWTPPNSAP